MGEFMALTSIQLRELRMYFLFSSFFPNMISFLFKLLIFYSINNVNLIYIWNKINFIIIKYPIYFENPYGRYNHIRKEKNNNILFFRINNNLLLTLVSIINLLKIY